VRRLGAAIFAALLLVGLSVPATFAAAPTTSKAVPKVVFIVGPAGDATEGYRSQARAAASIARHYTPDVVELYSPDATWPAVQQALDGASLVVYMGHGNGWPSRYRDALFPGTQDGFGLNPTAPGNDATHQYFGEADIAAQVKLARNAVVLLNHLCYASGLSEPGLPEGTLDQAHQRIDNYAAGFIKAGAAAVVAEAWSSPSYMVKAILGGGQPIQATWQDAPSANGHRSAFTSVRSPGYVAQMDTEAAASGFTRSIVMKAGLAPADVRAGAAGSASAALMAPGLPLEPTLIGTGIKLGTPDIAKLPAAGTAGHVDVPFTIRDSKTLNGIEASVRWDPIEVATIVAPADPTTEVSGTTGDIGAAGPTGAAGTTGAAAPTTTTPATTPATAPTSRPSFAPSTGPSPATAGALPATDPATDPDVQHDATVGPSSAAAGAAAPPVDQRVEAPDENLDLVVPEKIGDVVAPAVVGVGKKALSVPVTFPTVPGRYRLTVSLHDSDGVAYDAATQAMIPSLIVRVTGDYDGAIQAAPTADLTAGTKVTLGVRVVNLGKSLWGHPAINVPSGAQFGWANAQAAYVVGRWVPLSVSAVVPSDPAAQVVGAALPIGLKPGVNVEADLDLTAPPAAGDYLLLLDIVTPERGSLVASGANPTLIRITVAAAPTP
jgi:hypothetical protein